MKKLINYFYVVAIAWAVGGCTSDETTKAWDETRTVTFTATQERGSAGSRTAFNNDATRIYWQSGDQLSVFDTANRQFSLQGASGSTIGSFTGTADIAADYTAVYPYTATAELSGSEVSGVTLPATQTATAGSYDKAAAIMMAYTTDETLNFKNAVAFVKVKPTFACKKVELKAVDTSVPLAGTGVLNYNGGAPTFDLSAATDKAYSVSIEAATMAANQEYYLVVPAVTLAEGWSVSFTATDDVVYKRVSKKQVTFKRSMITDLGTFSTDGDYWYNARGIVREDQEVDLGLTIEQDGKTYRVLFAKSNLTATGLADKESDFGDYFAWAATEPWYTKYTLDAEGVPTVAAGDWKSGKEAGYVEANAPYYDSSSGSYTKYNNADILEKKDDAANKTLGGDWMIPTQMIWEAIKDFSGISVSYSSSLNGVIGLKFSNNSDASKYIFLPAASEFRDAKNYAGGAGLYGVNKHGKYWSGNMLANEGKYAPSCLFFLTAGNMTPAGAGYREWGYTIRPVRLVEQ